MTQQLIPPGFTSIKQTAVDEISSRHDEPTWLRQRRREAWGVYEAMDFPAESDEEWRRTDVRSIVFNGVRPYGSSDRARDLPASIQDATQDGEKLAGHIIQQDST